MCTCIHVLETNCFDCSSCYMNNMHTLLDMAAIITPVAAVAVAVAVVVPVILHVVCC